jgi:hypothetical protein
MRRYIFGLWGLFLAMMLAYSGDGLGASRIALAEDVANCKLSASGQTGAGDTFAGEAKVTGGFVTGNWNQRTPSGDVVVGTITFLHCRRDGGGGPGAPPAEPNIAEIEGTATFNGVGGYEFAATLHDHGEGTTDRRLADDLAITVANTSVVVYSGGGLLVDGNIQIHAPNPSHP